MEVWKAEKLKSRNLGRVRESHTQKLTQLIELGIWSAWDAVIFFSGWKRFDFRFSKTLMHGVSVCAYLILMALGFLSADLAVSSSHEYISEPGLPWSCSLSVCMCGAGGGGDGEIKIKMRNLVYFIFLHWLLFEKQLYSYSIFPSEQFFFRRKWHTLCTFFFFILVATVLLW